MKMLHMIMSMTVIMTMMNMIRLKWMTNLMTLAIIVFQDAVPNDYTNVAVAACDDGM